MKELAFIFTIDRNRQVDEKRFEYMSLLLIDSIKRFNPEADIFCGVFSNRIPSCKPELSERTKDPLIHYIEDTRFYIAKNKNAGYLRNYAMYYFSHIMDLTEQFENVVCLDVDVILTAPFKSNLHTPKNGVVLVEEFDDLIKFYEAKNTDRFAPESGKITWFHNWIQIINKSNKHAFRNLSKELNIPEKYFFSDFMISYILEKYHKSGEIELQHQSIGTIPFYSPYDKDNHFCIHYDNFERRGTFICTKDMLSRIDYMKFKIKGENYLNQTCKNDPDLQYWKNAVEQYKIYKPEHMQNYPQYCGEYDLI